MATTHLSGKENEGTKGEGLKGSFPLLLDEIEMMFEGEPEVILPTSEVWQYPLSHMICSA